ncbi:MAG: type II toxin-antitoxin system VapC family toxin [Spirochaetaceae bacterium]|nr:MAG: type II toxin-antitoxin system VapC family toxin [Spirochaetaceae bacterium]
MYLLDTNICIFLKNRKPPHVLENLKAVIGQPLFISNITVAELQFGVYNSLYPEKNRISLLEFLAPFQLLDFDDTDAEQYGKIRKSLKDRGLLIGPMDLLIAAQALTKKLILVTNNTAEFERIDGLRLEDWK